MASGHTAERLVASRYLLRTPLGRGGMGVVWRALDTLLQREVAVKEIELPAAGDDTQVMRARVLREARAAARLHHHNVVTVYDVTDDGGRPYIVMELVEAPSLTEVVRAEGPLSPEPTARLGLELLDALEAAHAQGVVHRDVKPSNVLVDPSKGTGAKLTDFGVASIADDPRITKTGFRLGSPAYMAPEQAMDGDATAASDRWSLGATLYYAVEGVAPFERGHTLSTLTAIVSAEPRAPERAGALAPTLLALLQKDPARRPSAVELRSMLTDVVRRPHAVPPAATGTATATSAATTALAPAPGAGTVTTVAQPQPQPAVVEPPQRPPQLQPPQPAVAEPLVARSAAPVETVPPLQTGTPPPATVVPPPATGAPPLETGAPGQPVPAPDDQPPVLPSPSTPARRRRDPGSVSSDPAAPRSRPRSRSLLVPVLAALALVLVGALALNRVRSGNLSDSTPAASGRPVAEEPGTVPPSTAATTTTVSATTTPPTAPATTTPPSTTAPSTSPPSTTPSTARPSTTVAPTPTTAPPTTATPAPANGAPAGWASYTDPSSGYQLAHPAGWTRSRNGTLTDFRDPNSGAYIRIDTTGNPRPSALGAWQDYEPSFAARHPGYRRIRLEKVAYRGYDAAEWEYTYGGVRAVNFNFVAGGRAYAINVQSSQGDWGRAQSIYQSVKSSFRPAS